MGDDSEGTTGTRVGRNTNASRDLGDPPDELGIDRVYSALAHPRRRYLCDRLDEESEWTLTDLATSIAAWENDVPKDEVTAGQRDDVYVALYHAHVPKLADIGVVTFDRQRERVSAGEHAERVLSIVRAAGTDSDRGIHTNPS